MHQIRAFEQERKEWESERHQWEEREQNLSAEKAAFELELARLHEELERLRANPGATPRPQGPVEPPAAVRSHHQNQLALMVTIDDLRRDLREERTRTSSLEQKAVEAERTNRRLALELDRVKEAGCSGPVDLDTSTLSLGTRKTSITTTGSGSQGQEELSQTLRSLESSRKEVLSLEDETVRLREELNAEKEKVIELKRAAHSRAAAWKAELVKVQEELTAKLRLDEEVVVLRKELSILAAREAAGRKELERLQSELEGQITRADSKSSTRSSQSELELQQQNKLMEHFLRHALDPSSVLRRSCRKMLQAGAAGKGGGKQRQVPPIFEASAQDLTGNLMKLLEVLRFAAEVLESREQHQLRHEPGPPLHRLETSREQANVGWAPFGGGWTPFGT